jgi:hypothetical protein
VCFKLTTDTIEALTKHYRNLCCDSLKAHPCGDVMMEAEIEGSIDNLDLAIEHFFLHTGTDCLEEMEVDGFGELTTQHSTEVKSAISELYGPYERYLSSFPEL